jgi:hypothetical protein
MHRCLNNCLHKQTCVFPPEENLKFRTQTLRLSRNCRAAKKSLFDLSDLAADYYDRDDLANHLGSSGCRVINISEY